LSIVKEIYPLSGNTCYVAGGKRLKRRLIALYGHDLRVRVTLSYHRGQIAVTTKQLEYGALRHECRELIGKPVTHDRILAIICLSERLPLVNDGRVSLVIYIKGNPLLFRPWAPRTIG
jgi:hypothetical protein